MWTKFDVYKTVFLIVTFSQSFTCFSMELLEGEIARAELPMQKKIEVAGQNIHIAEIPEGSATFGCDIDNAKKCSKTFTPTINVSLQKFYIMTTKVTFELWGECVKDGECPEKKMPNSWKGSNLPVVNVSWYEITEQFIPWLHKRTGYNYRLPTEFEWEYVALSGMTSKKRTVSNSETNIISCEDCNGGNEKKQADPVAINSANSYGLYSMFGNTLEWTEDCWMPRRVESSLVKNADSGCMILVTKGSDWGSQKHWVAPYFRFSREKMTQDVFTSFRLVVEK